MAKIIYLIALALICIGAECVAAIDQTTVFDVTKFGAVADGAPKKAKVATADEEMEETDPLDGGPSTENAMAFIRAWNAACHSNTSAKLLIPKGSFTTGEITFQGPCSAPKPLVVELQGTIKGDTDISLYSSGLWINFDRVDGVLLTGGGTIDGQGHAVWKYKVKGQTNNEDNLLPVSLYWQSSNNSAMQNIKILNSKGFHMKIHECANMHLSNLTITAPHNSPNTDGCHISDSTNTTLIDSVIGTGDDCISIGDGNNGITVSKVFCGPGHGISVGSLGKRPGERDVHGISVTNCTFSNTTNGARIKTYRGSLPLQASNIVYEDIIMYDVKNPIVIDQNYHSKANKQPSKVKVSDVHFRNIRGTTVSPIAISLNCSQTVPCEGVELSDINLKPSVGVVEPLTTAYVNAKYSVKGTLNAAFIR